ncbi:hypothetical protein GCM10027406_02220 [Leifsonia lichenia]
MASVTAYTSYGRGAGSARVRVFDWLDHLGLPSEGSDYLGGSSNGLGTLARQAYRIPGAELRLRQRAARDASGASIVSRQASPFSTGRLEARILERAGRGVYDFDDALMHAHDGLSERLWPKARIWLRAVRAADVVIAGNDYLADAASVHSPSVTVIPSCVEPDEYRQKQHRDTDAPTAVWLGSPSTEDYLLRIAAPLLAAHRNLGLRLVVISAGDRSLGALDAMVERVQWRSETFATDLLLGDFGIMPMPDNAWTRGKCAYKLLQYGAAALPSIGDDVGANTRVLSLGAGLATRSDDDWYAAIESLVTEGAAGRAVRGASARAAVDEHYSFDAWTPAWKGALGLA